MYIAQVLTLYRVALCCPCSLQASSRMAVLVDRIEPFAASFPSDEEYRPVEAVVGSYQVEDFNSMLHGRDASR